MEKLRLGLVGCGGMGTRHLYGLKELTESPYANVELAALCDIRQENAELAAKEAEELLGVRPQVFTDLEEMARHTDDLAAVDVVNGGLFKDRDFVSQKGLVDGAAGLLVHDRHIHALGDAGGLARLADGRVAGHHAVDISPGHGFGRDVMPNDGQRALFAEHAVGVLVGALDHILEAVSYTHLTLPTSDLV